MADAASVTDEPEVQSQMETLKHLGFVKGAVEQAADYASKTYDYAKDNTGPLKPSAETIGTTVKTVVGPAYDKFHEVLKFMDAKVDESVTHLDSVLPPAVKDTAKSLSTKVVSDVQTVGLVETAKQVLGSIEPVAEEYVSSAYKLISNVPLVSKLVDAIAPVASYVSEKYNETVQQTAEKGYQISSYLPLVPTEKIAKIFTTPATEAETATTDAPAEEVEAPAGHAA